MADTAISKTSFYKPLDPEKRETRVIDLQPGRGNDPVVCHLRTISIADESHTQPYDALSYVWGGSHDGLSITVVTAGKRHQLPVTDNLHAALRNIRPRRGTPMAIWVDAVCINQTDDDEKNGQVAMMGQVYESAKCVRIWLGEGEPSAHRDLKLVSLLPRIFKAFCRLPYDVAVQQSELIMIYNRIERVENTFKSMYGSGCALLDPQLRWMESALRASEPERAWFTRAWVFQEYRLASKTIYHFGRKRRKGPLVSSGLINVHLTVSALDFNNVLKLLYATDRWERHIFGRVRYFSELMDAAVASRYTNASEPKDKVYSLLGVVPKELSEAIKPDYSPTFPTWKAYACATIANFCYLRRLYFDFSKQGDRSILQLPTWAWNFANAPNIEPLLFWDAAPPMDALDLPTLSEDCRRLSISGARFAQVQTVFHVERQGSWYDSDHAMRPWLSETWTKYCEFAEAFAWRSHVQASMPSKVKELSDLVVACGLRWRSACLSPETKDALNAADASWRVSNRLEHYVYSVLSNAESTVCFAMWASMDGHLGFSRGECEAGDILVHACGVDALLLLHPTESCWALRSVAYIDHPAVCYLDENAEIRRNWHHFPHDEWFELC